VFFANEFSFFESIYFPGLFCDDSQISCCFLQQHTRLNYKQQLIWAQVFLLKLLLDFEILSAGTSVLFCLSVMYQIQGCNEVAILRGPVLKQNLILNP